MNRRVVITGLGVMAPGGVGTKEFWHLLTDGRTATRRITFFDPTPFRSQVAAEIDFDPAAHRLTPQEVRRMDRSAQLAAVATDQAVHDSGLEAEELATCRTGVTIGTAVGATMGLEEEYRVVSDDGPIEHAVVRIGEAAAETNDKGEVALTLPEGPADIGVDTRRWRLAIPLPTLGRVQLWKLDAAVVGRR